MTYTPGQPASLELIFGSGQPPYLVTIDWGDGNSDSYVVKEAGSRLFEHLYRISRSLTVSTRAADQLGSSLRMDFAAVSFSRDFAVAAPVYPASAVGSAQAAFNTAWWAYGTVVLTVLSLWAAAPGATPSCNHW